MKRKEYESPQTLIAEVETEACFCGSVVDPDDSEKNEVTTSSQEVLEGKDGKDWNFGSSDWQ